MNLKQKTEFVADTLEEALGAYEDQAEDNVLDCLMRTVLSQNTNDVNRDKGYAALRNKFPTWEDVCKADVQAIGETIKIAGLHTQKSRTIKDFLTWLKRERGELDLEFVCEHGDRSCPAIPMPAQGDWHQDGFRDPCLRLRS